VVKAVTRSCRIGTASKSEDRLRRATMMLATAATTAASSTCQRSSRRHRLFFDRASMVRFSHYGVQVCRVRFWAWPSAWPSPSGPPGRQRSSGSTACRRRVPRSNAASLSPIAGRQPVPVTFSSRTFWCPVNVARHSYAILEAELRGLGRRLAAFPDECGALRDALWYCDLTTSPDGEPVRAGDRNAEIKQRYGPGHIVTRFITEGAPELLAAVERTERRLAAKLAD
jgi:hypothetical protein